MMFSLNVCKCLTSSQIYAGEVMGESVYLLIAIQFFLRIRKGICLAVP